MIFRSETKSADSGVQPRGRMVGTAGIAVVLTVALAGCTTDDADAEPTSQAKSGAPAASAAADPSATPSPEQAESAEPDDPEAIIEQRTADAIERYKEYTAIKNDTARRGETAVIELDKGGYIGSHDIREYEQKYGDDLIKFGRKQTGEITVTSVDFLNYEGNPSKGFRGHEIQLTICLHSENVGFVDESGNRVPGSIPDRFTTDVTMRGIRWTGSGKESVVWAVASDSVVEEGC